ncbi:MAG: DUF262 domain-containing protein [Balneolales bacterium]
MRFNNKTIKLKELTYWIEHDNINLKPYYQRNDIWTRTDQESLIDSILKGYPLPSFFIYKRKDNDQEMVDGQQRARTIYRFCNNIITNSGKTYFDSIDKESFINYKICVTELYDVTSNKEIEEFYVLVNKKGKQLTAPEINKAEYADTNFLKLAEDLLQYQGFINLNLFTEATTKRMSDRNFIEELILYLNNGIQDKKKNIEILYSTDLSSDDVYDISTSFKRIIDKIEILNEFKEIKSTRYKQRSDFYTLFNFINENQIDDDNLLIDQYKSLLLIEPHISPSNDDCYILRDYALNCVSQSNSKKARTNRLNLFNSILLNSEKNLGNNRSLMTIANYLDEEGIEFEIKENQNYYLLHKL